MSQNTKYDFSKVRKSLETIYHEDRRAYRELYKLLLKIESLKNSVHRVFALKLFCDIVDILNSKTG